MNVIEKFYFKEVTEHEKNTKLIKYTRNKEYIEYTWNILQRGNEIADWGCFRL